MAKSVDGGSSDYGSDFTADEEEVINGLLVKAVAEHAIAVLSPPTIPTVRDIEDYVAPSHIRSPKVLGRGRLGSPLLQDHSSRPGVGRSSQTPPGYGDTALGMQFPLGGIICEIELTAESKRLAEDPTSSEGRDRERERQISREQEWTQDATNADPNHSMSPLERFRKPPNKALSVTDLVSPAWCELQYWYSLTKFGRKRRTPAMKQGSVIHKGLEDEIHTTVPVEITTKEDAWALRIWNIIQGLRTLREFGMTRELEVWGLVDGELVNGVIDQLSYECPDPELEASAAAHYAEVDSSRKPLPDGQMSLTDYLLSPSQGGKRLSDISWESHEPPLEESSDGDAFSLPRIYITDVKTRGSSSIPTLKSATFRPTSLQLQLYYHMLNRMVTSDDVSIDVLASRYDLDPNRRFTDAFIAEVGGLNDQFFDALSSQELDPDYIPTPDDMGRIRRDSDLNNDRVPPSSSQDSTTILLEYNTLASLWRLMKDQLRLTFLPQSPSLSSSSPSTAGSALKIAPSIPAPSQPDILESYPTLISPLLTAEFISADPTTESDSRVLGRRSFLFDTTTLMSYLSDQMDWWRGKRAPRGVEVTEAWKCQICEFNEICSWRREREWDLATRNKKSKS